MGVPIKGRHFLGEMLTGWLWTSRPTWEKFVAVNIQTSKVPFAGVVRPGTYHWTSLQAAQEQGATPPMPEREREPIDENFVELPHLLLEMSHIEHHAPELGAAAHVGVAGLAIFRAAQSFQVPGWAAKLEGVGAAAIAASSIAAAVPGGLSHAISHGAAGVHGLIELGLGAHQAVDAVTEEHGGGWKQFADGTLGVVKGLSTLTPLVLPGLETPAHLVELGATIARIGLKASS